MKGTLNTLYSLLAIAIFLVATGIITYTVYSYGGEPKTSDFGHFGSFIGGVSSTLLGATTSLFLLYQLSKMDQSMRQQEQDRKISEAFNRLDYYDRCISEVMKVVFAQLNSYDKKIFLTFGGLVGEDTFDNEFSRIMNDPDQFHLNVFQRLASKSIVYAVAAAECCLTLKKEGYTLESSVRFCRFYDISKSIHEQAKKWQIEQNYYFSYFEELNEALAS